MLRSAMDFDVFLDGISKSRTFRRLLKETLPGLPTWVLRVNTCDFSQLAVIADSLGPLKGGEEIIDFGCGFGGCGLWIAERLGLRLIGVDISPKAIGYASTLARTRGLGDRARFVVADACATGLPDGVAAAGLCLDAIMFFNVDQFAAECRRVLRPGGVIAVRAAEWVGPVKPPVESWSGDFAAIFHNRGFSILEHRQRTRLLACETAYHRRVLKEAKTLELEMGAQSSNELLVQSAFELMRGPRLVKDVTFVARL